MPDILQDGKLILHGTVGYNDWWNDLPGFTAMDVIRALAEVGRTTDTEVHVNSGGGLADQGIAIYNALDSHKGKVSVFIDAVAASAASIIAMAGDAVTMLPGSMMMIHDPATYTTGTQADHQKAIAMLDTMAASMASIYADRTGMSAEETRKLMADETWLTADAAVEKKFATGTATEGASLEASAFNYQLYRHPPQELVALTVRRGWAIKPKGQTMPNETLSAASAADVMDACVKAGIPALASLLVREGATAEQVASRLETAKEIRAAVALAAKQNPAIDTAFAEASILAGASLEKVRADLFAKLSAADAVNPTRSAAQVAGGSAETKAIVAAAVAKINKRNGFAARK